MACPLCGSRRINHLADLHGRIYWRCRVCYLAFMDPQFHPTPAAERAEYLLHENSPDDPGYRQFLARLTDHLTPRLPAGARGLDYGCGPGPALAPMLREQGFAMQQYDPHFARDPALLARTYDFITCTETAEHFFHPRCEFDRLDRLLRPGGWLGVMTEIMLCDERFRTWWYPSDPTHVCFYRQATLAWIALHYGWRMHVPRKNVTLFHKLHAHSAHAAA
jgi:SAM-dependent methyltransferase